MAGHAWPKKRTRMKTLQYKIMLKKKKFTDEENRILIENYFRGYAYC